MGYPKSASKTNAISAAFTVYWKTRSQTKYRHRNWSGKLSEKSEHNAYLYRMKTKRVPTQAPVQAPPGRKGPDAMWKNGQTDEL
jgi:hypothetical protein